MLGSVVKEAGGKVGEPAPLDRLVQALASVPVEGGALPEAWARELASLFGAERVCAFRALPGPHGFWLEMSGFQGFPCRSDAEQRLLAVLDGCAGLDAPAFDPRHPAAPAARPNQVVRPLAELSPRSRKLAEELLGRFDIADRDVMRAVVCDGSTFLAWVGLIRHEEFTAAECGEFQRVVPGLRDHLALALRLQRAELCEASLSATLEALHEPTFLLRRDGRFVASNRAAEELGFSPAELREQLERALAGQGGSMWIARRVGSGVGAGGYLLTCGGDGHECSRVTVAARRWKLTRAERRVLAQLAEGCSNGKIAGTLGSSVRTVEIHVSAILRKSALASRAAVAAELARMGDGA